MVTIQRLDPIYVDINQSSAELRRQQLSKGDLNSGNNTTVKLKLEDVTTTRWKAAWHSPMPA